MRKAAIPFLALFAAGWSFRPLSLLAGQSIVLNELMTSNGATLADENGDSPDWIELYNPSAAAVELRGYGLSDDPDQPFKWRFRGATLDAHGHLLVFASGKDRQPEIVASVNPVNLSGLKLWLSADAVSTTDPNEVRLSGSNVFVKRWRDRSGQGNDALQTTETLQPLRIASAPGLGGRPSLRFDGANDLLRLVKAPAQDSFSLFVVARTSVPHEIDPESLSGVGGVTGQRYLFGAAHGGDFNAGAGLSVGTNGVSVYEHGSNYMPALAVHKAAMGARIVLISVVYENKRPSLFLQGSLGRTGLRSARVTVRAPTEIGAGAYGAFQGDIAEILIYERALTETERRGLEEHLARKYGLTLPAYFHSNFQLRSSGERVRLTHPDGLLADQAAAPAIPRDVSYGRQPDGGPQWLFFARPTPGNPNTTAGSAELLQAPQFSHATGFYTNSFLLTLNVTNPGVAIRYTLDGSEPTLTSSVYSGPIAVTNRASAPNKLSLIPTIPSGYQPPLGSVFKGAVVRARTFKAGALTSATVTRTFFVHPLGRARYTVPVISLITDPANFFNARIGIYVPGNAPGGNYSQRGEDWERPVYVEFIETNGALALAQEADVKIHGNTSQNFPIKGLDLDATGGKGRQPFRYRIFPDRSRAEFEHVLLRPSGHDYNLAFMRDELMQSLATEFGMETQAALLAVVFLNGEYWGLHYVKEKEDTEFVAYYGNTAPDNLDYLEGYAAARAGDTRHYDLMIQFLKTRDIREAANYARVQTLMDVPNYIEYKVAEIFCYRWDIGNHRLWRARGPEGRWRWLQFDNDVGWGGFWSTPPAWSFNMLEAATTPSGSLHEHNNETTTFLLRKLLENETFKRDFINRFADLLNATYQPSHAVVRIDRLAAALEPEMREHINRWRAPGSLPGWRNNVQSLRSFANQRPGYARQHLVRKFGLQGTATLTLAVSNTNHGRIQLNTLTVAGPTDRPWSGVYFKGNPITITALPKPGFRFDQWQGIPSVRTNSMTLLLNGDLGLTALFLPEKMASPIFTSITPMPNGDIQLRFSGQPYQEYRLQVSSNLLEWTTLGSTDAGPDSAAQFDVGIQSNLRSQFFRLLLP